ncbi:MAG: hypothetical protein KIT09_05660 [Bryobacteraceae bacterium]|nr:hypothetical protein [Bryobacteraceae bacterium]
MKHRLLFRMLPAAMLVAGVALAQPVLRTNNPVVNGGSYANTIAPGSIFVVFGTNLAGDAILQAPSLPLATSLGGVSIRFTPSGGGSAIDALMVYTTRNQIAGLLPSAAAPGRYTVTVTYNGQTSPPGLANVTARSLGIVSADSSGGGQAQAQIYYSATAWSLNRFAGGRIGTFDTAVAHPGEAMVLWLTGIGADPASDTTGGSSGDRTSAAGIRIRLGNREIVPAFAGRASGLPGTDQVNFTVPADAQLDCAVPLQITTGDGGGSNQVTLAIAAAGQNACSHPFLTADQLRAMSEGGTLVFGYFNLGRQNISTEVPGVGGFDLTTESVGGQFARYGVGNLGEFEGDFSGLAGSCFVTRFQGDESQPGAYTPPTPLDAGNPLRLNGPNAANVAVERLEGNYYSHTLYSSGFPGVPGSGSGSPTISAGAYTLSGTGGVDIGAFNASVTVPSPLTWTNRDAITEINRSQNLNLTWTGGGSDLVWIFGSSAVRSGGTEDDPIYDGAVFICYQNANAGSFSVPSAILSQLPASGDILEGTGGMLMLSLTGPANGGPFTAPLTAGGNIVRGSFTYSNGFMKTVSYE